MTGRQLLEKIEEYLREESTSAGESLEKYEIDELAGQEIILIVEDAMYCKD